MRAAYDSARAIGLAMQLVNGQLMFVRAVDEEAKRLDLGDAEATDGAINGISDLHIGSNYFMHDALADHVAYGVKNGAKLTTISGDLSEGDYPHAAYERTANGCEAQVKLILDPRRGLPYHEGHRYVVISGNHDETFEGRSGISFGRVLIDRAKAQGRHDIVWAGSRGALLAYRGLLIYLHHPKRGPSYALSYQLQTWVRDRDGDQPRPNILLCGHHHRSAMVRAGKTYCFHAGTFQHGDSAFGRSLGGSVAVGGWLLRGERDKRRISRMIAEWRPVLGPPPFAIPVSSEVTP